LGLGFRAIVLVIGVDGDDNEAPTQNTETSHGILFQAWLVRGERIENRNSNGHFRVSDTI
jgi:hypothetical protein